MKIKEEELRDLYRRQTSAGATREACLSAEDLARMAAGELTREDRRRALAHVELCSDCALELRLIGTLEPWSQELVGKLGEEVPDADEPVRPVAEIAEFRPGPHDLSGRSGRWRRPLGIAAALVLMTVAAFFLLQTMRDPGAEFSELVLRGDDVTEVAPIDGAVLSRAPGRLEWPAEPGASDYRVRIFDARAELLWESENVVSSAVDLPPAVRERLGSAASFLWTVEVAGLARRQKLGPFRFEIREE